MATVKVDDVKKAGGLLRELVVRADLNDDGTLSSDEIALACRSLEQRYPEDRGISAAVLRCLVSRAARKDRATLGELTARIDHLVEEVLAAGRDEDGRVSAQRLRGPRFRDAQQFVEFAQVHGRKSIEDLWLPPRRTACRPAFNWGGAPDQAVDSLLEACSDPARNDYWPIRLVKVGSRARASRYVIGEEEAGTMTRTLRKLFPEHARRVLTELARRSQDPAFGCVSFSPAAQRKLRHLARELSSGELAFGCPPAPTPVALAQSESRLYGPA